MTSHAKRGPLMKRKYELFEKCPDGLSLWRNSVFGFQLIRRRLQALVEISENQYYAIDIITREVLAFIWERAMLKDSAHYQELKGEAKVILLQYGRDGGRIMGQGQRYVCTFKWVNWVRKSSDLNSWSL